MEKKRRPDRLERLEEALYSRNESRLPVRERASIHQDENNDFSSQGFLNEIPLEEIVSKEREHPHRKLFEKFFLISLSFAIIAAGFAGYKFFLGGPSVSDKNIDIAIGGPSIVSAGSPVSLDVRVENRNAREINNVILKVQYPSDSRSADDRTKVLNTNTINIGTLGPGKSYSRQFSFVVYGQKDDTEIFNTHLEYTISGSSATFVKEVPFNIVVGTAPVLLNVSIPNTVVSRQPFDIGIVIKSNSPDVINNVVLSAEYPFGYSFISSDRKAFTDNNVWQLGDIPSGDSKTIHIRGTLEAENNEERTFKFYVGVSGGGFNAVKSRIASQLETVAISKPFISLTAGVVGGGGSNTQAGDRIPIEIKWTNNLSFPVTNAIIKATISGVFDQSAILPQFGGFYSSKDQTITWQQSDNEDLKIISPGGSGTVRFTLAIPKDLPTSQKNQGVSVHVTMTATQPDASSQALLSDADLSFKFRANPSFSAYATRSQSPYNQTGPIPPRVNQQTSYTVVLSGASSFADISNAVLTAVLPPNVSWNNIVSPGSEKMSFDSNSRTLTWNIGSVIADGTQRKALIQLVITPSSSQIGFAPSLLTKINFSGVDSYTNLPISIDIDDVNTELVHDIGVSDNAGAVTK